VQSTPPAPRILLAILAKQKEKVLTYYLSCIENLDYPKKAIVLYVRANNSTDSTNEILLAWLGRIGNSYAKVITDFTDVTQKVERFDVHEWNGERFSVLGKIRQESLWKAWTELCDFYFVVDVDNFLYPKTLSRLVKLNLPIVAPFLKRDIEGHTYSNYHAAIDVNGYHIECPFYHNIWGQTTRGLIEVPVVHCTYLVRRDVIPLLYYQDGSGRYEYVIFSDSARITQVPQYFDNREVYGYLTLDERVSPSQEWMQNPGWRGGFY